VTDLAPLLARVRLAVFDFDGVFTDNRVWVNERGEESVRCSRSDGLGLRRLDEVDVSYLIVSTEANAVVRTRAARAGATLEEVAYVGNDVNDAACLGAVGLPVVPADAWPEVVPLARWVLTRAGGEGCVREFCDAVWEAKR
jgi:3-deoxy-D-manno-octulosonate 8-phosphate phosphatase KdsC-like HAD superfamily phosphatase